ncbi:MAG: hypothetical protein CM15mP58_21930 [Burkholderiaceae bacterium]|nr:MAG: hypothetical protein CM15mP58_21930 [Burkholderiaceae bacterium]
MKTGGAIYSRGSHSILAYWLKEMEPGDEKKEAKRKKNLKSEGKFSV